MDGDTAAVESSVVYVVRLARTRGPVAGGARIARR